MAASRLGAPVAFAAALRLTREIDFETKPTNAKPGRSRESMREPSNQRRLRDKQKAAQDVLSALGDFRDVESRLAARVFAMHDRKCFRLNARPRRRRDGTDGSACRTWKSLRPNPRFGTFGCQSLYTLPVD